MKLAGYSAQLKNFAVLRSLTKAEITEHKKYGPIFAEARERLKLFQILGYNYREWKNYLDSLLSAKPHRDEEMLHLDRLLLNYVTCAYVIEQHFKVSFQQRFRDNADKQKTYKDFLSKLYSKSWATAFFLDFRGFVQHCGLGIGFYDRQISSTSVKLILTCDARELVKQMRRWDRSKLTAERGTLEIVPLLRECHFHMLQSYGAFVAKTFFPELTPAAKFYGDLTKELRDKHSNHRMIFLKRGRKKIGETGNINLKLEMIYVPNDLFGELGISAQS